MADLPMISQLGDPSMDPKDMRFTQRNPRYTGRLNQALRAGIEGTGDCVFCDIIAGKQTPANFHDYGSVVRFTPLNPVVPGHRLFVPKMHVATAADDPAEAARTVAYAIDYASGAADDFNVIVNNGTAASQTVFHLHWHVVPRRSGDGLVLPWTGQSSVSTHLEGDNQ